MPVLNSDIALRTTFVAAYFIQIADLYRVYLIEAKLILDVLYSVENTVRFYHFDCENCQKAPLPWRQFKYVNKFYIVHCTYTLEKLIQSAE